MSRRFVSAFAGELDEFLTYKRALGHPYARSEYTLLSFDRFVREHGGTKPHRDLERLLLAWLARLEDRKPVSVTNEIATIRQFCLFRRRRDPRAFVPGRVWAPQSTESEFLPHVLSEAEVRKLLAQTEKLRWPFDRLTAHTLVLVLYCTGLRVGEALRLELGNVDLRVGSFFVRHSKRKSRLVPFGRDLGVKLKAYRARRDSIADIARCAALFVRHDGRPLGVRAGSQMVRELLRQAGLKPARGRVGPRPYDLRHTYAVHRLTRWHRAGIEVHSRLPLLSAYMGHDDILGTEVYLTATPELLAIAARRFEAHFSSARPRP